MGKNYNEAQCFETDGPTNRIQFYAEVALSYTEVGVAINVE